VALLSSPLPPVRVVGRYALFDEIAAGGMATVHIGRLLGPVGFSRTVAIKRLHPQFAKEPDFVAMFLDEARLAARIRHPNVVGTLDIVALDGELFLVMEYVQGESLARLMRTLRERGEGVPIPIAATIIVGVLEGLHAAHEATSDQGEPLGIVHRDVSPQNILVGTDGVARVVDFGVAKAAGRVQSTRNGQLKGKLGYMAPEQIGGNATRATDVHAVAVVLWEMLTARRLYHAENELQTFSNILTGELVPPSTHASNIPPEIDALVMKGLEPKPEARFASAREMARTLQRVARMASPSDVGDWVESLAGPNVNSRARKIAAMESSGMLPAAESSPDPIDSTRPSLATSHPPVSGEHLVAPRSKLPLVLPLAVATLAVGAVIGILIRVSGASGPLAVATQPADLSAPPTAKPGASPWTAVATKAPEPIASSVPAARADPPQAVRPPPLARPWPQPAAQGLTPIKPMSPSPPPPLAQPPQPTAGGGDFTHVMDSRK
jgi:serine/threonine protein kinase